MCSQLFDKRHYRWRHWPRNRFFLLTYTIFPPFIDIGLVIPVGMIRLSGNKNHRYYWRLTAAGRQVDKSMRETSMNAPHSKSPSSLQSHYNNIFLKITGESAIVLNRNVQDEWIVVERVDTGSTLRNSCRHFDERHERQGVFHFCMEMVDNAIRIWYRRNVEEWKALQPSYPSRKTRDFS